MKSTVRHWSIPPHATLRGTLRAWIAFACCAALSLSAGEAAPPGELPTAARQGDVARVRDLLKTAADLNTRDARGNTALHWAALNKDADMVTRLLRAGANPNATNNAGATPLIYGAGSERIVAELLKHKADPNLASALGNTPLHSATARSDSSRVVKLLLKQGANPIPADTNKISPLWFAAFAGDVASARLLLDHGALPDGDGTVTPLMMAALSGNLETVKLLLDRGADPKKPGEFVGSALNFALYARHPEVARLLIERGADLHSRSPMGDGAPPMVWAAYNDLGDDAVIRALLARGVSVDEGSHSGETALSWTMKRGHTELADFLRRSGADDAAVHRKEKPLPNRVVPTDEPGRRVLIRSAAQKAVAQLQRGSDGFLENKFVQKMNCVSCHHQTFPALAFGLARERGIAVDKAALTRQIERQVQSWQARIEQPYEFDHEPQPDAPNNVSIGLMGLHALGHGPDELTEAHVRYLLAVQNREGYWPSHDRRPPLEDGPILGTALTIRAVQLYPLARREKKTAEQIERARRWLLKVEAKTHNERVFQLLGLVWAGEKNSRLRPLAGRILSQQRPDGGWAQLPGLESDAWATGQALVVLHDAGVLTPGSPAYQRGLDFLLRTQFDDGSWWVRSRSWPFQPHFDSNFPHGKDQWVSAGGTAWAAMALLIAIEPGRSESPVSPSPTLVASTKSVAVNSVVQPIATAREIDFVRDIKPLLERSCVACHSGEKPKGGYSVTTREDFLKGGSSGEIAVMPGQSRNSLLLRFVRDAVEDLEMPPRQKRDRFAAFSAEEIEILSQWIDAGAVWPDSVKLATPNP